MFRTAKAVAARTARRHFSGGVSFGLTEDQLSFQETARSFAESSMAPHAAKWDAEKIFPTDVLAEAGDLGFGALYASEEYGTGASRLDASIVFEQLAMACPGTTAMMTIHNMCCWMIDKFGTDEQRARLLTPELTTMKKLASYCLTEPDSGSDAAALKTKAVLDGDNYILNGSKAFISGAGTSEYYLVMARTGEHKTKGISCFVVPKDAPGVSFGKNENKMGWNCQPTRIVSLENVAVPKENLLGGVEGQGFKMAMMGLDGGRINIATCSLGAAQKCVDLARDYANERKQFGTALSGFQNTQFKLAEMATKVHTSRLIIRQAAAALDAMDDNRTAYCAMAKMHATEECWKVVDDALQIHGGYGYLRDYPVERFLRDLRVHRILEGTNEVMRMIISRQIITE